jgi:hypothetical protein
MPRQKASAYRVVGMRTVRVPLVLCFSLASCIAAPRTEFMGPNGKMVYPISCQTMSECAAKAREICPDGHEVLSAASGADNTTARGGIGDAPERKLLIECHSPAP